MPASSSEYTSYSKHPHRRRTPSFSSSLLDTISRSIDNDNQYEEEFSQRKAKTHSIQHQKQQQQWQTVDEEEDEITSLKQQIMMEKWANNRRNRSRTICSYSTSSGSTIFSSSETESTPPPPPPSSINLRKHVVFPTPTTEIEQTPSRSETKFMKTTKQRALKIYGDLKKVKQPISPGGRISNFLNSILGSKKLKKSTLNEAVVINSNLKPLKKSKSVKDFTTTTGSSYSSSCLIKTPPALRDLNSSKRSVRFLDEDSKNMMNSNSTKCGIRDNNNKCSYQSKINVIRKYLEVEDEYDDEDNESCSSSDLFELDSSVGIGAYCREELPVFGTTNFNTNLAIANGFIR